MSKHIYFVHGMYCGPWYWENYIKYFEDLGYTTTATTLRYHDMDPADLPNPALGKVSLLDYAADLESELKQFDSPPIIIGHSMGALLAQILASRGLCERVVLLTPVSPAGINSLKPTVIRSFFNILTRWGFWRKPNRMSFWAASYALLNQLPPVEQKAVYRRFVYESGRAAAEIGFWFLDPRRAAKVDAAKVNCPMLVVAGEEDHVTPVELNKKVADKYNADYKAFSNHAHFLMIEPGWEKIAAHVADWLEPKTH